MKKYNVRNVGFFGATTIVALIGGALYLWFFGFNWHIVFSFLFMLIIAFISVTSGYHRLFAHRSYEAASWLKFLYLVFGAAAFQESCLKWASDHRVHHQHVDQEKDPYNIKRGFWWAHMGWILSPQDGHAAHPKDLTDEPLVMWQHKYWMYIGSLSGFVLPTVIGAFFGDPLGGFLFGGVIRIVVQHHLTFTINSLAHMIGTQPYSDKNSSKDSWITAVLTFGEGYHNYHHWYARDYRNGLRFYHWDPGKWLIRFMNWFGQTWNLKQAPEEKILKARLYMERLKVLKNVSFPIREKMDQLFESLMNQADEMGNKRRAWIEAKKKKSTEHFDRNILALREGFKMAKAQYKESYKAWKIFLRGIQENPAIA